MEKSETGFPDILDVDADTSPLHQKPRHFPTSPAARTNTSTSQTENAIPFWLEKSTISYLLTFNLRRFSWANTLTSATWHWMIPQLSPKFWHCQHEGKVPHRICWLWNPHQIPTTAWEDGPSPKERVVGTALTPVSHHCPPESQINAGNFCNCTWAYLL